VTITADCLAAQVSQAKRNAASVHSKSFLSTLFPTWPATQPGRNSKFPFTISNNLYKLLLMSATLTLNASFAALADPTRRAILARLARGEATVMELAKPFEMSQPAISQHLKVLEEAGLIVRRVEGTRRPRRLARAGIAAMDEWLRMLRNALEKNYERLDEVLAALQPDTERKTR
jgi:DNA-binding transcriptional ArsR family regulator